MHLPVAALFNKRQNVTKMFWDCLLFSLDLCGHCERFLSSNNEGSQVNIASNGRYPNLQNNGTKSSSCAFHYLATCSDFHFLDVLNLHYHIPNDILRSKTIELSSFVHTFQMADGRVPAREINSRVLYGIITSTLYNSLPPRLLYKGYFKVY